MIGEVLGHYRVTGRLGAGGMGEVWVGRDERLGREVAIKMLQPVERSNTELQRRLEREARAIAALDHPAICTIYEINDTADGRLYMVMARYHGEALAEKLVRGPLELATALDLAGQVASGLDFAHGLGIVHRDIKPGNVFITERGEAKILDFGLAKMADATVLTQSGMMMGTVSYMAPEQVAGRHVDHRADIWAFGVLVFEMLTGARPFRGDNHAALMHSIVNDAPQSLAEVRPDFDPSLERAFVKVFSKEADARFGSAAEFLRGLTGRAWPVGAAGVAERVALDDETAVMPEVEQREESLLTDPVAAGASSIAILGFANLTQDESADWLSTGIAESVGVDLRKLPGTSVVARQKVGGVVDVHRGELAEPELARIASVLSTRWLVWGGFQKVGDSVRIIAHCRDARDSSQAAIKVDGSLADIFALQDSLVVELIEEMDFDIPGSAEPERKARDAPDVEAYEYYARGRRIAHEMAPERFTEAADLYRKAIAREPGYALAHAGLGELHCMRYIGSTDPADLDAAIENLNRAIELDPELADPYQFLSYSYMRRDELERALECGRRAIELDGEAPFGHYFTGAAHWARGVVGHDPSGYAEGLAATLRVTQLAPRYQPGYQVSGDFYLRVGRYEEARACFERASEIEESGEYELARFVGAFTMLGRVSARTGATGEARSRYRRALEVSGDVKHVYSVPMAALARLGLAEADLRERRPEDALTTLRQAMGTIEKAPRALGIGWFCVKAKIGLARAFSTLFMRREETAALAEALELREAKDCFDFSCIWEGGEMEMEMDLAVYHAESGRQEEAVSSVLRAAEFGWRETRRVEIDPLLVTIRNQGALHELVAELEKLPPLPDLPPTRRERA